jgi:O-antigen/teichoic acid export membrane protein
VRRRARDARQIRVWVRLVSLRSAIGRRLPAHPAWTRLWLADSALLVASQILTIVATSSAAVLVARHLDPHDWGVFSGLLGLSMAVAVVIQFGTGGWLLRELSRLFAGDDAGAASSAAQTVDAALVLNTVVAALGLMVAIGVAEISHLSPGVTLALAALLTYSGLLAAASLMETHLRARRRVGRVAAATILEKYLLVMLVVTVALAGGGVAAIGLAYVIAGTVRVVFVRRSIFARGTRGPRFPGTAEVARVFRNSLPFALTAGCLNVIPKLDTFLLLALSATSAGYFAIGDRLVGAAIAFPEVLSITLYPFFSRRTEHHAPPWMLSALFAGVGLTAGLAVIIVAPTLVPLVFGAKYADAVPAVRTFALALPFFFAVGPLRVHAYSRNLEKHVVAVAISASLAGTVGIVTGQWLIGTVAAAGAYVMRQLLFLSGLSLVCLLAGGRDSTATAQVKAATIEQGAP